MQRKPDEGIYSMHRASAYFGFIFYSASAGAALISFQMKTEQAMEQPVKCRIIGIESRFEEGYGFPVQLCA